MPIHIKSHAEMLRARTRVQFCYLCGGPLSEFDELGVSTEHIVPRGATDIRVAGVHAWNATLPVHRTCELTVKKPHDDELISMQRVHCRPLSKVGNSDRKRVYKGIQKAERDGLPPWLPVVSADSVLKGLWNIVRGMHTALYGTYLPPDAKHMAMPPAPSFSTKRVASVQQQIDDETLTSDRVMRAMDAAILNDEADGITAWGGSIRYRSLWHTPSEDGRQFSPMCLWVLTTPEAHMWSRSVTGRSIPWRGYYLSAAMPSGGALLSDRTICTANAETVRKANQPLVKYLAANAGHVPPA